MPASATGSPLNPYLRGLLAATAAVTLTGTAQADETGRPDDRQLLFFNHAYGVVDRATADAIEHSTYLREFADFEVRTTTGGDGTWTGRYLKGRETYLELFGVGDLPGPSGVFGAGGMGVSVERDGQLATVVERLRKQGIVDPFRFQQQRDFGDGIPVPWFDALFTTTEYDTFGVWGMEYAPEYFADPRSKTEPAEFPGDISRERYLPDAYRGKLMRDVSGIHLAVTERDLANTVPMLKAGGFHLHPVRDGVKAVRGGTTIRLDGVPIDEIGLRSVDFSLKHRVSYRHEEQLGRSTLVVGPGDRATWTFPERPSDAAQY